MSCPVTQMFERIEALLDALAEQLEQFEGRDAAHRVRIQRYELHRISEEIAP